MYDEQTIQQKQYPTIAEINEILKKFNATDDTSRDVRPLKAVLMRMANASPRIKGHIVTRNTALYAFEWDVISPDNSYNDAIAKVKQRLDSIIDSLISSQADTSLYDSFCYALKWEFDATLQATVPRVAKIFDPDELDILKDGRLALIDLNNIKTPLDVTNKEYLFDNLKFKERGGCLRSIVIHELLRNDTLVEWSNLNKRMKGIITGTIDGRALTAAATAIGMNETQISKLVAELDTALKGIGETNYLRTMAGVDIQMNSLVDGAAGGSFSTFKSALDNDISIAVLGQANTSELPHNGGSRAALQILNLIRTDILFSDMLACQRRINRLLLMDYQVNVSNNATTCPYKFKFLDNEAIDYEANARKYEILQRMGVTVSKSEFYRELGIHEPETNNAADVLTLKSTSGTFIP